MDLCAAASRISEETDIEVSERDLERILGSVRKTSHLWYIVDYSDVPIPALFSALGVLKEMGLLEFVNDEVRMTPRGMIVSDRLHTVEDMSCSGCGGRGLDPGEFTRISEKFNEIQKSRPAASHDFDQGYVTPETSVSRFVLAYERGDVEGRDILVLGDDDLVSIILGLSGLAGSITVVEIDSRLTDFIRSTAEANGFSVNVQDFDLRNPLPAEHAERYDTFFTDPPETIMAADAFIGRGVSSLKGTGAAGYFGFTRREASLRKWFDLQRLLLGYGVVITDIIHNFSEYVNWGYEEETRAWELAPVKVLPQNNWYRSSIYRIQTLDGFRGSSRDYGRDNIYEDRESSTT